ncbi:MAG: hypothetical protein WCL11_01100 [Verrucomicrobiota bacterium]
MLERVVEEDRLGKLAVGATTAAAAGPDDIDIPKTERHGYPFIATDIAQDRTPHPLGGVDEGDCPLKLSAVKVMVPGHGQDGNIRLDRFIHEAKVFG